MKNRAGRGRPKKRPEFDSEKVMNELTETVCAIFEETGMINRTAEEIGLSTIKVRKILVAAGYHDTDKAKLIDSLYREGKTPEEIMEITGLGKTSVNSYLPYTKTIYKTSEVSLNADRIALYRQRQACVKDLQEDMMEENLWLAVVAFEGYPFYTATGLPFSYVLKRGRDGTINRELVVSRRKESKTLAWISVVLAFNKALDMKGEIVPRPKAIGDIRGISYIYPMLYRFGVIEVPDLTAKKMKLKGGRF